MLKRIIITIVCFLIFGMLFLLVYLKQYSIFFDNPNKLSNKTETIEVGYVNWACDCANFYDVKLFVNNSNYELKAEDCIFIEPATKKVTIPKKYFDTIYRNKNLRLTGRFYMEKGISKSYKMKTPEKPKYANVFQYDKFEIINKTH